MYNCPLQKRSLICLFFPNKSNAQNCKIQCFMIRVPPPKKNVILCSNRLLSILPMEHVLPDTIDRDGNSISLSIYPSIVSFAFHKTRSGHDSPCITVLKPVHRIWNFDGCGSFLVNHFIQNRSKRYSTSACR